jgi:hypothetical protein
MPAAVPSHPDLRWYFAAAEAQAGGIKSQHGSFVAMAQIGPRSMPAPIDAERALGRRFDQVGGMPSEAERARGIYLALQRLTASQVEVLARAYGPHDLQALAAAAYPGDFAARDRLLQAFGEYLGIVAMLPGMRRVAKPSGARGVSADPILLLDTACALLADALAAYRAARATTRAELAEYSPAGRAAARTATEYAAAW